MAAVGWSRNQLQKDIPGIDDPHEARVVRVAEVAGQREAGKHLPVEDLPAAPVRHPRDDIREF